MTESNIRVSIIVPVYNVERYLKRCIKSVLCQTYGNFELILVDDGSKDSSGSICEDYAEKDARIKVIHKSNGGLSSARNEGLNAASGEYVSFLDGDDYFETDMLEKLLDAMIRASAQIAVIGRMNRYEDGKAEFADFATEEFKQYTAIEALKCLLLRKEIDVSVCDKLFRKSLFDDIRFPVGENNEDCAIILDVFLKCGCIAHAEGYGYNYCHREGSITRQISLKSIREIVKHAEYIYRSVEERAPELLYEAAAYRTTADYTACRMLAGLSAEQSDTEEKRLLYKEASDFIKSEYKTVRRAVKNLSLNKMDKIGLFLVKTDMFVPMLKIRRIYKRK